MRSITLTSLFAVAVALASSAAFAGDDKKDDRKDATAPKVFTNADLPKEGTPDGSADVKPGTAERADKAAERAEAARDKQWDGWHRRYLAAQARVDSAQKEVDALNAEGDKYNGDVDRASDGSKIGPHGGRGYYVQVEVAKRRLSAAQAQLDRLRAQADAAGVPPGVMR